ncbi:imelysin [Halomonas elongata]|uniref:Imelysin n=1 Tax=Halomonas elongata TaxID=2746 RepID=A0A1B8P318_HALEL|nr:imelysin family protein [Halomonas elongata]OBX36593.1 imelysin [Halomonas elongata]
MFKRLGRIGLAALTLATAPLMANEDTPQARERWHQAIDQRYGVLSDASERLEASAIRFCQQPDTPHRKRLSQDWMDAYQAWQAVRFVDFGPIEQQSRAWQLQFWPDRKNLVGRKMQAWLAADQPPPPNRSPATVSPPRGFRPSNTCSSMSTWKPRPCRSPSPAA